MIDHELEECLDKISPHLKEDIYITSYVIRNDERYASFIGGNMLARKTFLSAIKKSYSNIKLFVRFGWSYTKPISFINCSFPTQFVPLKEAIKLNKLNQTAIPFKY